MGGGEGGRHLEINVILASSYTRQIYVLFLEWQQCWAGRERDAEGIILVVPEADAVMELDMEERAGKQREPTGSNGELTTIERWKERGMGAGREERQAQTTPNCPERSKQDCGEFSRQGRHVSLDVSWEESSISLEQVCHSALTMVVW